MKKGSKVNRLPTGPTKETLKMIARAATLHANGRTREQIAADLGVKLTLIAEWRKVYAEWWQRAFDHALKQHEEFIRQIAGTEAAIEHARGFIDTRFPAAQRIVEQTSRSVNATATGTLAMFRDRVARLPAPKRLGRVSATTVNGYLRWMQAVLDKAGPPARGNRDAADILARVPWIRRPIAEGKEPRVVSAELLDQLYRGLVAAELPRIDGFKPPAWWRTLIVVAYNTGLRRGTLFGLRMTDIDWARRTIVVRPSNNKSRKLIAMPLNETAYRHLLAIRTDRDRVFAWPHCRRWFDTAFKRLQASAGIPPEQRFGLRDLRKTLATLLYEASPGAAQIALGHSDSRTTQTHYVAPSAIVARALDALPQPETFKAGKDGAA